MRDVQYYYIRILLKKRFVQQALLHKKTLFLSFYAPRSTPHASCPQDKVKTRKADMMDRGRLRAFIPPAHYVTQAADSEPIVY